jgi:hypothetical protein
MHQLILQSLTGVGGIVQVEHNPSGHRLIGPRTGAGDAIGNARAISSGTINDEYVLPSSGAAFSSAYPVS